jgi:Kdo2-lipid IVA lauroyltransferase/acyltransferase
MHLMNKLLYSLIFGFVWLFSLIPSWLLYRISDVLYLIIYYIARYRKKAVFKNLTIAFPDKSEQEIEKIAKAFYRHFSDFLLEITRCIRMSKKDVDKHFKVLNPEIFQELARKDKSFALVSAHYNNWEWMINFSSWMPHDYLVIYRPLRNWLTNRLSVYMRSRHGANLYPMESIFREALKRHANKQLFCILFLADQRPPWNSHFWTIFMNHETAFFEGVEKMSKKLDLAVVFMDIQKVRRGYYEARYEILFESTASLAENAITLSTVKRIEEEIKARPEFWLWSHKRFKHTRPENINLIRP